MHSEAEAVSNFVHLSQHIAEEITLSGGHYLRISSTGTSSLKIASMVQKGDFVPLASGMKSKITKISSVQKIDLYHPQTLNGNIVVVGHSCFYVY